MSVLASYPDIWHYSKTHLIFSEFRRYHLFKKLLFTATHMRTRRLFEAPFPLLTELRLLIWMEFLLHRLDMDS